jgi:MFS family permease
MVMTQSSEHADSGQAKRAIAGSALGSALEWADFTAYGAVAATVFPKLFFPTLDPASAILASFATFGVGFFARPAGGIVFGILGDRIGRKKVLLATFMLMGVSSLLIGLMPTYAMIGIWAPIAIVFLRFLQGFALGGEATGAQLFTMEHSPPEKRGTFGAFVNVAAPASMLLANGMLAAIAALMDEAQFEQFGWRIPFLLSIFLILTGVYLRYRTSETPIFMSMAEKAAENSLLAPQELAIRPSLRPHIGTIVRLICFWAAPASCFWIVNIYSITYLGAHTDLSRETVFSCILIANGLAVVTTLIGGAASDRFGRKPPLYLASLIMLATSLCYFSLLDTASVPLIILAMGLFGGAIQAQSGILPAYFAEQFPTAVRYSGSALAYTGANLIFAGPTPFIAAWISEKTGGSSIGLTAMCVGLVTASLLALIVSPETKDADLSN